MFRYLSVFLLFSALSATELHTVEFEAPPGCNALHFTWGVDGPICEPLTLPAAELEARTDDLSAPISVTCTSGDLNVVSASADPMDITTAKLPNHFLIADTVIVDATGPTVFEDTRVRAPFGLHIISPNARALRSIVVTYTGAEDCPIHALSGTVDPAAEDPYDEAGLRITGCDLRVTISYLKAVPPSAAAAA